MSDHLTSAYDFAMWEVEAANTETALFVKMLDYRDLLDDEHDQDEYDRHREEEQ